MRIIFPLLTQLLRRGSHASCDATAVSCDTVTLLYVFGTLAKFPPQGRERCYARRFNAEGDVDGKNHRYADNHVFR